MKTTVTPMEALRRLIEACKLIDYADCKDETVWQALGAAQGVAEGVVRAYVEPVYEEELVKVKRDVEEGLGYGFMVDGRRVGMDRIVWFNRPGETRLHARRLTSADESQINSEFEVWIGPRRTGESPQELAIMYWAQEAYRAGRLDSPLPEAEHDKWRTMCHQLSDIYDDSRNAPDERSYADDAWPQQIEDLRAMVLADDTDFIAPVAAVSAAPSGEVERDAMSKLSNFVADNWSMKKYTLVEIEDGLRSSIAAITATKEPK